jgi:hypothetical protein
VADLENKRAPSFSNKPCVGEHPKQDDLIKIGAHKTSALKWTRRNRHCKQNYKFTTYLEALTSNIRDHIIFGDELNAEPKPLEIR